MNQKLYFLGIGGSGMSSLAHWALDLGYDVNGYDKIKSSITNDLESRGVRVDDTIQISETEVLVYSTAFRDTVKNSKLSFKNRYHRSELLHFFLKDKFSISVAGSHGKTSTTAMIAEVLFKLGKDPSYMIGAQVPFSWNQRGGKGSPGKLAVYESDESDGTFVNHKANIRICQNIDNDHLDYFGSYKNLELEFEKYLALDSSGTVIVQGDDPGINALIKNANKEKWIAKLIVVKEKYEFYGYGEIITFQLEKGELIFNEHILRLPIPGRHYLRNALVAVIALEEIGIPIKDSIEILKNFQGIKRRMEFLGETSFGLKIYDDYGHHPTEIQAVLDSLKEWNQSNKPIYIIFQPHRYSRTAQLEEQFLKAFELSGNLYLLPIYSAGETPIPGISSDNLCSNLINRGVKAKMLTGDIKSDKEFLKQELNEEGLLLCLGAGNVNNWGIEILS